MVQHTLSAQDAEAEARVAPVFFLGLQKSGTSSFAHFMGELGWPSLHGMVNASQTSYGDRLFHLHDLYADPHAWNSCADGLEDLARKAVPNGELFVQEMDDARRAVFADIVRRSSEGEPMAAADTQWPHIYRFLDHHTAGRAKFVLWRRDAAEWARSYLSFFDNSSTQFVRFQLLSYGEGCASQMTHERLATAYAAYNSDVLSYFAASAARRRRLLELDFTAPDAGRRLCEFVHGGGHAAAAAGCARYTSLPTVEPNDLDPVWLERTGGAAYSARMAARVAATPLALPTFECGHPPVTCTPRVEVGPRHGA